MDLFRSLSFESAEEAPLVTPARSAARPRASIRTSLRFHIDEVIHFFRGHRDSGTTYSQASDCLTSTCRNSHSSSENINSEEKFGLFLRRSCYSNPTSIPPHFKGSERYPNGLFQEIPLPARRGDNPDEDKTPPYATDFGLDTSTNHEALNIAGPCIPFQSFEYYQKRGTKSPAKFCQSADALQTHDEQQATSRPPSEMEDGNEPVSRCLGASPLAKRRQISAQSALLPGCSRQEKQYRHAKHVRKRRHSSALCWLRKVFTLNEEEREAFQRRRRTAVLSKTC